MQYLLEFLTVSTATLSSLAINKIFLEDLVQSYGRVLTSQALGNALYVIDNHLIDILKTGRPMTSDDVVEAVASVASAFLGGDWSPARKRKALRQIMEEFRIDIFLAKASKANLR